MAGTPSIAAAPPPRSGGSGPCAPPTRWPEGFCLCDRAVLEAEVAVGTDARLTGPWIGVLFFSKALGRTVEPARGADNKPVPKSASMPPLAINMCVRDDPEEVLDGLWHMLPTVCSLTTSIRVAQALSMPQQHCPPFWQADLSGNRDVEEPDGNMDSRDPSDDRACLMEHEEAGLAELGLNRSQEEAIESALRLACGVRLGRRIRGPPGTGKTQMLVAKLAFLLQRGQRSYVHAPTNIAVKELAVRLARRLEERGGAGSTLRLGILASQGRMLGGPARWGRHAGARAAGQPEPQGEDAVVEKLLIDYRKKSIKRIAKYWQGCGKYPWPGSGGSDLKKALRALGRSQRGGAATEGATEALMAELVDTLTRLLYTVRRQLESLEGELPPPGETADRAFQDIADRLTRRAKQQQQEQRKKEAGAREACEAMQASLAELQEAMRQLRSAAEDQDRELVVEKVASCRAALDAAQHSARAVHTLDSQVLRSMILRHCMMLFCTVTGAGQNLARLQEIKTAVVDEACMVRESENIIVLRSELQRLVLVGDPKQLPAGCRGEEGRRARYDRSLFERLEETGVEPLLLNVQYRMHRDILAWPNDRFYANMVKTGAQVRQRPGLAGLLERGAAPELGQGALSRFGAMRVFDTSGARAEERRRGTSWSNEGEARLVLAHLDEFFSCCRARLRDRGRDLRVGIITPYRGQIEIFKEMIQEGRLEGQPESRRWLAEEGRTQVATVDGFQGQECDIVVISCTRSGGGGIGFLSDERRLNVAVTRARLACWVFGDFETLISGERFGCWESLARFARKHGWLHSAAHGMPRARLSKLDPPAAVDWSGSWEQVAARMESCQKRPDGQSGYACLSCGRGFKTPEAALQHLGDKAGEATLQHPAAEAVARWAAELAAAPRARREGPDQAQGRRLLKVVKQRALGFETMSNSVLPADFSWDWLAMDLQATGAAALLMDPALAPVLYYVHSPHPHLYGRGDAPVDLYEHCRKLVSHDGFPYDIELGLDPASYVYAAKWACLLQLAGLHPSSNSDKVSGILNLADAQDQEKMDEAFAEDQDPLGVWKQAQSDDPAQTSGGQLLGKTKRAQIAMQSAWRGQGPTGLRGWSQQGTCRLFTLAHLAALPRARPAFDDRGAAPRPLEPAQRQWAEERQQQRQGPEGPNDAPLDPRPWIEDDCKPPRADPGYARRDDHGDALRFGPDG
ncbi:unnamed protein product [Prorocentrum cordatum]|uniref:RNA helicase n=1 Tax=Prorocentrum cordatum TaxID=2364126 RepID=A0ABN9V6F5_9DINO|nr:unnamed protein product [Polarella glacialis]